MAKTNNLKDVKNGDEVFSTEWGWVKVTGVISGIEGIRPVLELNDFINCTMDGKLTYHDEHNLPTVFRNPQEAADYLLAYKR